MTNRRRIADRVFDSVDECVRYLAEEFPDPVVSGTPSIRDGLVEFKGVQPPRFLYRGESANYATTHSTQARLGIGSLPAGTASSIIAIRDSLNASFRSWLEQLPVEERPDPDLSMDYLRHYGLPTEHLDLTEAIRVAAYFASRGTKGRIAVVPIDAPGIEARDLTRHPYAWRARAQRAHSATATAFDDWKSPECRRLTGIRWFGFPVRRDDRVRFGGMSYLLSTHIDRLASAITSLMYNHVIENGPVDRDAAAYLAAQLPPHPLIVTTAEQHTPSGEAAFLAVTPGEAGVVYIEHDVRAANREAWASDLSSFESL